MTKIAGLSHTFVLRTIKRKVQQVRYVLSDRTDLQTVRPWPRPLGYDRIYHYHIRKTAGSSLNTAFKNAFSDPSTGLVDEEAQFARNWGVVGGRIYVNHNEYLLERGDFFYGDGHGAFHEVAIPANTFKITILRDPASRALSYYRMLLHWRQNDIKHPARKEEEAYLGSSFSDFLSRVPRQHLMRQLSMFSRTFDVAEAARNIATLNFVMTTESFSEHLRILADLLDIDLRLYRQKSSYGAVTLTDAERARLVEALAPEYALLDAVKPLAGVYLHGGQPTLAPAKEDALARAPQWDVPGMNPPAPSHG